MKTFLKQSGLLAIFAIVTFVQSISHAQGAPDGPVLRPGAWAMTAQMPDGTRHSHKECITGARDLTMEILQQAQQCSSKAYSRAGGQWQFTASCTSFDKQTLAVKANLVGDFNSRFTVQSSATLGKFNKTQSTQLDGKWMGSCDPKKYIGGGSDDNG